MDVLLREKAFRENKSLLDYIIEKNQELKGKTGVSRTLFAVCPNSMAVIKAALVCAKKNNAPIKFAATLNQVDQDGGYTGMTPAQFVNRIKQEARSINLQVPVIVAIDHGGPWLKDAHRELGLSYEESMAEVKKSFEAAIDAGYDLIHVDPTIDVTLPKGEIIQIETVVDRTVELMKHCEDYRKSKGISHIAYEVGTEEVHGGLADMSVFTRFFDLLKEGLTRVGLPDVWPCFVVGKVGTDLHTTFFDPEVASEVVAVAAAYNSVIKGHYSDNVVNPEGYPAAGMGGANVGPEFTEKEYEALLELEAIENRLLDGNLVYKSSGIKKILWDTVIASNRWKKWLQEDEVGRSFEQLDKERQEWLIKTGCRYIWQDPKVVSARSILYENLESNGIQAERILITYLEKSMDKYFYKFNLVDLNDQLISKN